MPLLIDGHNLIGAMPDIDLAQADDEHQLVLRLRMYCADGRRQVTVVFDSGPGPAPLWNLSGGGVTVRFAPPGVQADQVIVRMVEKSETPTQITVVTNDRGLAGLVRAAGGQVRSATQFALTLTRPAAHPRSALAEHPEGTDRGQSEQKTPGDPAFADIYAGFAEVDKDAVRFGADIDLDVSAWIERLYGNDPADAARAAHWLGRFGGPAGLAPLLDALTHRQGQARSAALLALAELGDRRAVPEIAKRTRERRFCHGARGGRAGAGTPGRGRRHESPRGCPVRPQGEGSKIGQRQPGSTPRPTTSSLSQLLLAEPGTGQAIEAHPIHS